MTFAFHRRHAKRIEVLAVVFFTSVPPTHSAEPLPRAVRESANIPAAASADGAVIAASARSGKFFGARLLQAANSASTTAAVEGTSPAPIIVIPGPNGLTIASEDLEALDEFEHLLTAATDRSVKGPMAVFYLKYAKAQAVAEEIDRILSDSTSDSKGSSAKGSDPLLRRALAVGPITITPEPRLNALLVLANRADRDTVERLLTILDLKESPEDVDISPKPRMIPIEHARAKEIADLLRQVYADRLVVAQGRGRGSGMALLMRNDGRRPRRQTRSGTEPI